MNIKSLLLGSAAALAAVSGAQAADAIVAAEPEPMEYVRVCDAFGTGYFYIPGTETCLKIGGYTRFELEFGDDIYTGLVPSEDWDMKTRALLTVTAKSDTELGALTGYIGIYGEYSYDAANTFAIDEAYLSLGGLKAGYYKNWWDAGISGEQDDLASFTKGVSVSYEYVGDAFSAGLGVDEFDTVRDYSTAAATEHGIGIEAQVKGSFGPVTIALLGGYDTVNEEGTVRAIATAAVGPGTFNLGGYYSTDPNAYGSEYEWAIATSYAFKATDKLTVTPGFQYSANQIAGTAWGTDDQWKAGVLFDYQAVTNFHVLLNVAYTDHDTNGDSFGGWFRLQRDF